MPKPIDTLAATLHALSILHSPSKPQPIERDRYDADELADKAEGVGMWLAQRMGRYEDANVIADTVMALREQGEQIEAAKAKVAELVDEIGALRDQLATYRVVEVRPATRFEPAEHDVRRVNNDEDYERE